MGYTTEFNGHFSIVGDFGPKAFNEINDFLEADHNDTWHSGGLTRKPYSEKYNIFTRWCDWRVIYDVHDDSYSVGWNGNEKSYDMEKWLQLIIDVFLKPMGCKLEGSVTAVGEDPSDVWKMVIENDQVKVVKGKLVFEELLHADT